MLFQKGVEGPGRVEYCPLKAEWDLAMGRPQQAQKGSTTGRVRLWGREDQAEFSLDPGGKAATLEQRRNTRRTMIKDNGTNTGPWREETRAVPRG